MANKCFTHSILVSVNEICVSIPISQQQNFPSRNELLHFPNPHAGTVLGAPPRAIGSCKLPLRRYWRHNVGACDDVQCRCIGCHMHKQSARVRGVQFSIFSMHIRSARVVGVKSPISKCTYGVHGSVDKISNFPNPCMERNCLRNQNVHE